jgi:hypothetical protein
MLFPPAPSPRLTQPPSLSLSMTERSQQHGGVWLTAHVQSATHQMPIFASSAPSFCISSHCNGSRHLGSPRHRCRPARLTRIRTTCTRWAHFSPSGFRDADISAATAHFSALSPLRSHPPEAFIEWILAHPQPEAAQAPGLASGGEAGASAHQLQWQLFALIPLMPARGRASS